MKKKLLSALLAFALSLGTATIPAAAAEVDPLLFDGKSRRNVGKGRI